MIFRVKVQLLVEVYTSHDMKRELLSTENTTSFTKGGSPAVVNRYNSIIMHTCVYKTDLL